MRTPFKSLTAFFNHSARLGFIAALALSSISASGQESNVALPELGATAKGFGPCTDRPWSGPASLALSSAPRGGGMLFGCPPDGIKGGRIDIRLIVPVDITAIEVVPYDYHGTSIQAKGIDISVDGKMMKHVDLEYGPEKPTRIPLEAHGQFVSVFVTECHPPHPTPDGKPGGFAGGWSRVRVFSTTDVAGLMKPVDKFNVPVSPANIAPTSGVAAGNVPEVEGQPRMTQGHPCTLWDKEDIAHYKEMLKTSKLLQEQFEALKKSMDVRITQPLGVPQPQKGPDGKYRHISDLEMLNGTPYGTIHTLLSLDIANLGTMYAFTGDVKYGDYCKKLLLAYADAIPNYAVGARPGFAHAPSVVFDQVLGDDTWLIPVARGYDLIHDLPSMTPEERKHIEDDFIKSEARMVVRNHSGMEASTNWSAIATCSVLISGYATDDQELIDTAFYGIKGTKEKPTGGLFDRHFSAKAISADGLWVEGAMGYQFMALQALIADAEILWHHGIDMYRYRDCALKRLFDSPIEYSYPDFTAAAFHDSGHASIFGTDAYLYEYAYRRYRDPAYLQVLNQVGMHFDAHFQQFPVSVLYDRDPAKEKATPPEWKSVNFFQVGYGYLRETTEAGTVHLALEYGPKSSHGHPDKLTMDLFGQNEQLIMDPGSIWYEKPLYRRWYRTTMAHPTLVVDELDQIECGANQVVYAPADEMGMQRAWTRDAYPGVTMDRSLFLTPNYVADVFGAFARLPRKMDLAWHIRGQFASDLKLAEMKFPEPVENGYNELTNVRHGETDKPWSASVTRKANAVRFLAAGGTPTDVIVGDGHYGLETPPTILERRTASSTIYGNAVDISGTKDGYVKSITQEGNIEKGYGLLKIETPKGTDLCFASYSPGTFKAGGLETDALQAFVSTNGKNIDAMYLGGGKSLKVGEASLERSEPGLAYLEKAENGSYILANPSSTDATVTATLPALSGMVTYQLDAKGKRTTEGKAGAGSVVKVELKGSSKIEIAPKGSNSVFAFRQAMLMKRQAAQDAAFAKAREEYQTRLKTREAEAKEKPAPANTVTVVEAFNFSSQGGGEVALADKKRAIVGKAFSGWNDEGHWIEWTFDAPAEGYYNLTLCYCSENDKIERQIMINGEVQEPFAPMICPGTGGWANGTDDWRLMTAKNRDSDQPLLIKLKQGKNVVRLTNMNARAMNVNYVAITSPDVKVSRDLLAGKLQK